MAVEVISVVLQAKVDDTSKKFVLLGLANHGGPDGRNCFPSVFRLMIYTGRGESTVREKLKDLRNEGLIHIEKRSTRYKPTEYRIDVDRIRELRDPRLDQLSPRAGSPGYELVDDTPTGGGPIGESTRGPEFGGLDDSGVQDPESRGPGSGPETYFNHLTKHKGFNYDQTEFVMAKTAILNGAGKRKPSNWDLYDYTYSAIREEDGVGFVICLGASSPADFQVEYLADRRQVFIKNWIGVDQIEFITESEWEKIKQT